MPNTCGKLQADHILDEIGGASGGNEGIESLGAALKAAPATRRDSLQTALWLHSRGFWPVILRGPSDPDNREAKRPMGGHGWGTRQWTVDEIVREYDDQPDRGVGICLGDKRGPGGTWIIDIEGDGDGWRESLDTLLGGEAVQTMSWRSARGEHRVFQLAPDDEFPGLLASLKGQPDKKGVYKFPDLLPGLEIRIGGADVQMQSAVPPSIQWDKAADKPTVPREWINDGDPAPLPQAARDCLRAMIEAKAKRDGEAKKDGLRLKAINGADPLERARLYAETLDPAISGNGGHNRAFYAACKIGPGFNLTVEQTLAVLAPWNQRCDPPWSDAELLHKVEDAFKENGHRLGFLLDAKAPDGPTNGTRANGTAPRTDRASLSSEVDYSKLSDDDLGIVSAASVAVKPIHWLWPNRLPFGEMSLMAGEGGLGKSQVLLSIAAALSRGREWPDKSGTAEVGRTLILAAEDDPATTIVPRLKAMDADLSKIDLLTARVRIKREGKEPLVSFQSLQDLGYWRRIFGQRPDTRLLIVDPLPSYLGRGVNDSKNNEVRSIIEPFLDEITRPRGVCLIANSHLNKSVDSKNPIHRVNGSVAYANLARAVHFVVRGKEDPGHRVFALAKCNVAPDNLPAIGFRIEERTLPSEAGDITTAVPVFDDEPMEISLHEAMTEDKGAGGKRGPDPAKTRKLAQWLVDFMKDKGPVYLSDIIEAAGDEGFLGKPMEEGAHKYRSTALYRAAEQVPRLQMPPQWEIVTSKQDKALEGLRLRDGGRARWMLKAFGAAY